VLLGPCDPTTLRPDLNWLQQQLQGRDPPKMVSGEPGVGELLIVWQSSIGNDRKGLAEWVDQRARLTECIMPPHVEPTLGALPQAPSNLRPNHATNDPTLQPPPPQVVLVNPCNPTGVALTQHDVDTAAALTRAAGAWLVLDNT